MSFCVFKTICNIYFASTVTDKPGIVSKSHSPACSPSVPFSRNPVVPQFRSQVGQQSHNPVVPHSRTPTVLQSRSPTFYSPAIQDKDSIKPNLRTESAKQTQKHNLFRNTRNKTSLIQKMSNVHLYSMSSCPVLK